MAEASNDSPISEFHQKHNVVLFINVFVKVGFIELVQFEDELGFEYFPSNGLANMLHKPLLLGQFRYNLRVAETGLIDDVI